MCPRKFTESLNKYCSFVLGIPVKTWQTRETTHFKKKTPLSREAVTLGKDVEVKSSREQFTVIFKKLHYLTNEAPNKVYLQHKLGLLKEKIKCLFDMIGARRK